MFGIQHYGTFLLSAILLNLIPGPDTFFVLGNTLTGGRRAGVLSAFGISAGCFVHTLLAALGLSVILAQSALAFSIVKLAGAGYLIYIGVRTLLSKPDSHVASEERPTVKNRQLFLRGVMTNVMNPKVALFFLAFLPQFIDPSQPYGPLPFVLLGLSFIFTGTCWLLALATFSSFFTARMKPGGVAGRWLNRVVGALFVGLGIRLLATKA